jgi:large subunit ribosomal protein L23
MKHPLAPHVTEKSYAGISEEKGAASTYTFRIALGLTKEIVKRMVEREFKVTVTDIRIVRLPGKVRRFKGVTGKTGARKKAIVRLAPGQKIAAFDLPEDPATENKE